jgi:hypothetical protein
MKPPYRFALTLPLLIALLTGCSKQGTLSSPSTDSAAGASAEQAQVASTLASDPSYVDDEVSESPAQTSMESSASPARARSASPAAAVRPLTFWRQIRSVDRRFEFAFADTDSTGRPTTCVVTVHKHILGTFNLLVGDEVPEGSPPQAHVIKKPLVDNAVRRVLLRRVRVDGPDFERSAWRVVATSGVRITSRDAQTHIESLRVQSGALDTTITEPLAFFRLRRMIQLDPQADVTLTATTLRNDDVTLLYLADRRVPFHNNGDNTYSITFHVPDLDGLHHVGVNALSNGTLFDDVAPYDSQSWIEPFIVHPLLLAADTPIE